MCRHAESHLAILCGYYWKRLLLLEKALGGCSPVIPHNAASACVLFLHWLFPHVCVLSYVQCLQASCFSVGICHNNNGWRTGVWPCLRTFLLWLLGLPSSQSILCHFTSIEARQCPFHNSTPVPETAEICHRPFLAETWNHQQQEEQEQQQQQQQRSAAAIYNSCLSLRKAPQGAALRSRGSWKVTPIERIE